MFSQPQKAHSVFPHVLVQKGHFYIFCRKWVDLAAFCNLQLICGAMQPLASFCKPSASFCSDTCGKPQGSLQKATEGVCAVPQGL